MKDWVDSTLGAACQISIGGTPARNRPEFWDTEGRTENYWVSIRDLSSREVVTTAERITNTGSANSNAKLISKGTVLMSFKLTIGRVAFAGRDLYTNEAIAAFETDKLDRQFLFYGLQSWNLLGDVDQAIKGATLNKSKLRRIPIRYPATKSEQSTIAKVLAAVDRSMEQTEALLAKHERIKAGLMHDLLTRGFDVHGRLRDPATHEFKASSYGPIPHEWDDVLLDSVAHRGSGHTPSKGHPEYWDGGIKWVSLADSDRLDRVFISSTVHEISAQGIQNSSAVELPPGVVILSRDAGIGKSAITTDTMAVSQHFMAWRCGPQLNNFFLYYWLQSRKPEFENIAIGSTIKTIGLRFFREMRVPRPPIEEQVRIGEILFGADQLKFAAEERLAKLRRLKAGMMQDLLTGRVSVAPLLPTVAST